jgi:CheY-like chemotaxis protein
MHELDGIDVLVVDDNDDTRSALQILLESHGATVRAAESVKSALDEIKASRPQVLLSDIGMPEVDGLALIEKIRSCERSNHLPPRSQLIALAVTAYTSPKDRRRCLSAGYQFHIPKPVDFRNLLQTLLRVTGRDPLQ